jgi:hypothetical protein
MQFGKTLKKMNFNGSPLQMQASTSGEQRKNTIPSENTLSRHLYTNQPISNKFPVET